jgi:hypothetical protein
MAMNSNDTKLQARHGRISEVLNWFRSAKPEHEGLITLEAAPEENTAAMRGFCKSGETPPVMETVPSTEETPFEPNQDSGGHPMRPEQITSLRIGEWMRIGIHSPFVGFAHVFNLGTDGWPAKIFVSEGAVERPIAQLPAGRSVYLNQGGWVDGAAGAKAYREIGDGTVESPGKPNGHPERILAIVLKADESLVAGDLHDHNDWKKQDAVFRGGGKGAWSGGKVIREARNRFLRTHSDDDWEWGFLELPVVDS